MIWPAAIIKRDSKDYNGCFNRSKFARFLGFLNVLLLSSTFEAIYLNAAAVLISKASLGTFHNGTLLSTVRSGDSSIMRICEFKTDLLFPPEPRLFLFLVLLFMSNVGQCPHPPPCILCRNLWRLEVLFRGMFGGKGAGESPFWKAKSECERQKQGYFLVQRNMIHTSHPDNRPPCDKYTLLSLALDFPHISLFY